MTLIFTFYTAAGDVMGTVEHRVTVGATAMAEVFQVNFDSADRIGGYGYTLSVG